MKKLLFAISVFLVTFNFLVFKINADLIIAILSILYLIITPGILLLLLIKVKTSSFWETIVITTALGISFVMFVGLLNNTFSPKLGISNPLSTYPTLLSFNCFYILLILLSYSKIKKNKFHIGLFLKKKIKKINNLNIFFLLISIMIPIVSAMGAISLNNGGTNLFAIASLLLIAICIVFLTYYHKKVTEGIFPSVLYLISLGILLSSSLRGWHITGHDIQREYFVFQLAKNSHLWNIDTYVDPYNACLSLTIFPTIISNFFHYSDVFIFKIIFQILFAITSPAIFLLLKKYTNPIISFLSTLFFIFFPTFLNDITMLNRQEIGFIYFVLILFVIFSFKGTKNSKYLLYYIFSASLVVSHYSTTYITLGILVSSYVLFFVSNTQIVNKMLRTLRLDGFVSKFKNTKSKKIFFIMPAYFMGTVILWNTVMTGTSGNAADVIYKSINSISEIFKADNISADTAYGLFAREKQSDKEYIGEYLSKLESSRIEEESDDYYTQDQTSDYPTEIIENEKMPPTKLGAKLLSFGLDLFKVNFISRHMQAVFIQVFVLFGFAYITLSKIKTKLDYEYMLICIVGVIAIASLVLLPSLSLNYGVLRLFHQFLIVLALPSVIASVDLLAKVFTRIIKLKRFFPYPKILKRKITKTNANSISLISVSTVTIIFFLTLSGFFSQISGGYLPQMNLNNAGLYYNSYYSHRGEVIAAKWITQYIPGGQLLQANYSEAERFLAITNSDPIRGVIPETVRKSAFVFAGYTNTKGIKVISVDRSIQLTFPIAFLEKNKNLIYNNSESRIYK